MFVLSKFDWLEHEVLVHLSMSTLTVMVADPRGVTLTGV